MKKRINLFKKSSKAVHADLLLQKINYIGLFISFFCFALLLITFFLNLYFTKQLEKASQEKELLARQVLLANQRQLQLNFIEEKKKNISTFLKNDAEFKVYYSALKNVLENHNMPSFSSLQVDKQQEAEFSFNVSSTEEAAKLLQFVETDTFLSNFKELKITSLGFSSLPNSKNIVIQFSGVFKKNATT